MIVTTDLLNAITIANPVVEVIDGLLDRILLHICWPNNVFHTDNVCPENIIAYQLAPTTYCYLHSPRLKTLSLSHHLLPQHGVLWHQLRACM